MRRRFVGANAAVILTDRDVIVVYLPQQKTVIAGDLLTYPTFSGASISN